MTETPDVLTEPPPKGRKGPVDALSDVLAAVRLSGAAFLDAEFSAPWCIAAHVGPEDCRSLGPAPAHIIAYHYVVDGRLLLSVGEAAPLEVGAGEIVLLPRNDPHRLASAPGLAPVQVDPFIRPPAADRPAFLRHGGGGESTRIVCGFIGCDAPHNPLLSTLPSVLRPAVKDDDDTWFRSSFHRAAGEFAQGGIGSATVLGKLAELLFVEGVRRYLMTLPEEQTGWLAGLRDPIVGRALGLLHAHVAEPWTTEILAREAGLSRSAFAERFTELIGMPPMKYLAGWRLQLAATRLRDSPRSTAQIAYDVGYESEAAFCRAFKRHFGKTPAAWRKHPPVPI